MNTNMFLLIIIPLIICVILVQYFRKKSTCTNLEPFAEASTPQQLSSQSNTNEFKNTPLTGLKLDFKSNRPYGNDIPYNKKFDDLRKDKPLMLISEDKIFSDIIPYENQLDGRLGLDICLEKCNGECLEYGQTGNAYCFPNDGKKIMKSTFYETLRDKSYINENSDEKPQKLVYPNLR
jgi:hypothetical protein